MFGMDKMLRVVSRDGRKVQFINGMGVHVGTPYKYECATEKDAIAFAAYVDQRDPSNENMPIAVGPDVATKFHAKLV